MFSKAQREGHDKRHRCTACKKVRYEKNMEMWIDFSGRKRVTRYGNTIWNCRSNKCREKMKNYRWY
jgi:hypothetical protein